MHIEEVVMTTGARRHNGFTMIELVAVLLIIGIVGTIGAVGFGDAIRGYVLAADSVELAQKAQVALTRLNVELMHLDTVDSSSDSRIVYTPAFDFSGTEPRRTLSYDSAAGEVLWDGNVLIDNVANFSIEYHNSYDTAGTSSFVQVAGSPAGTNMIVVTITLRNAVGGTQTFVQRVFPIVNRLKRPSTT